MRYSLGVDVGGTKILGAVVDEEGNIVSKTRVPTDRVAGLDALPDAVDLFLAEAGKPIEAIGLAVAGFVGYPSGRVVFGANLAFSNPAIGEDISREYGLPVVVENDANAAAWAENRFGAGKGSRQMVMLTVGTGIGGGVILDGRLYRGSRGYAGEFGHMPVMMEGPVCNCGSRGCLETLASGRALGRMAQERAADWPDSEVLRLADGNIEAVTGAMVGKAADIRDPFAIELLWDLGTWLGVGLTALARAFDPEVIVVGGGVLEEGESVLGAARDELAERYRGQVAPPRVVSASLGNDAGVVGAAQLSLESGNRIEGSETRHGG
ncbi:MAG TPA: ROK family glucokinase [Actinomycetota bacterium]|nr:ROK family glucokinase [Actinomycetota bacterium]